MEEIFKNYEVYCFRLERYPKRGKKRSLVKLFKVVSFQQPVCCLRRTKMK